MDFFKLRNDAVRCAKKCEDFAENAGYGESGQAVRKIRRVLRDSKLTVMVIGEARTGKSSLLGAYLNDTELFPVDVDVTTCLISVAAYAEKEKITVVLEEADGAEKALEITRAEIAGYAKEQNNPNGVKRAKMILIETPNEVLKEGMIFIDSPGIGSLNPMHSRMTYQFLPRADVVLFVCDATSQISEPELVFLKSVRRSCSNILFVLTKKDMLLDCGEILDKNRHMIEAHAEIPEKEQIHIPVSSNMMLAFGRTQEEAYFEESNFRALDQAVSDIVEKRRVQILLLPRLLELEQVMKEIEQDIVVKEVAYGNDRRQAEELKQQLRELAQQHKSLLSDKNTWESDINLKIGNLGDELGNSLDSFADETNDYIAECMNMNKYKRSPELLKTEVVGRVEQQKRKMEETAEDAIEDIKDDFFWKSGIVLQVDDGNPAFDGTGNSGVKLTKRSLGGKAREFGKRVRSHSFSLAAFGAVAGGVLGGIAGFAIAGPAGALALGELGAGAGGAIGTGVGTVTGIADAAKTGVAYDADEVKKALTKYVSQTVKGWNNNKKSFVRQTSADLRQSLRRAVQDSADSLQDKINTLTESGRKTAAELKTREAAVEKVRNAYNLHYEELQGLIAASSGESGSIFSEEA